MQPDNFTKNDEVQSHNKTKNNSFKNDTSSQTGGSSTRTSRGIFYYLIQFSAGVGLVLAGIVIWSIFVDIVIPPTWMQSAWFSFVQLSVIVLIFYVVFKFLKLGKK